MNIEILCETRDNSNTYIVGNEEDVIIIDPSNDERSIKRLVNNRNVLGIFLTHGHFDHFKKIHRLLKIYDVLVYLQKNAYLKLQDPNTSCAVYFGCNEPTIIPKDKIVFVSDGQNLILNEINIKVIFTPGHTNCSVCYKIDDHLFSGDTIFYEGVGRWDLPTGSSYQLIESLNKVLKSKTDFNIYPGHGESSSCFHESNFNPYYIRNRRG